MIDLQKLRYWAEVLEKEIEAHRYDSKDVDALAKYQPLVESLRKVRNGSLTGPYDMPATGYWNFETDISRFTGLSEAFAAFCILLRGWKLPEAN
jgi:hypothetical protein